MNLALIGPAVLEKKIFENGGRTTTDDNGQRTDDGACLYYKLTNGPKGSGELKFIFYGKCLRKAYFYALGKVMLPIRMFKLRET